ncbi:DUF808 domain-containing protein [Bergeyella sp. RCAD1439]|uniref:DUF808 domain-containing protein n=1 Tax=Bergeyella anatis TaxID=3113737 RepID=UPI002E1766B7|nr:DUF808 family protein [Bergeyella sp. RCAD1439]
MASGFFAILDDIGALMDDVASASKIATRQTAGILGDDLAVNAEKATGFLASREIPVLMAIMKGSFLNKLIIVPIAFLLQVLFPPAIKVILVIGGLYLAFEGVEKIIEFFFHRPQKSQQTLQENQQDQNEDNEKAKIKSAITTDFILSIEIVIIALGTVLNEPLITQILAVSVVSILATVGVYGIVALIVRMDDAGYSLLKKSNHKGALASLGTFLIKALPIVIKALGVIGTIALILVAGGIFDHNIDFLHHQFPKWPEMLRQAFYGLTGGLLMVPVFLLIKKGLSALKSKK